MKKKRIFAAMISSVIALSGIPGNVLAAEEGVQETEFSYETDDIGENVEGFAEEVEDSVPEENWDAEEITGFSDGESEEFVAEDESGGEIESENQVFSDNTKNVSDIVESGFCGFKLTYTITGDESNGYILNISGTGDMYDYWASSNAPWMKKRENIVKIVMDGNITKIGAYAFTSCSRMTSVVIPESVTDISHAFPGCSSLTSVIIPEGVTNMDGAFYNCESLVSVTIPDGVTSINEAFWGCDSLVSVTIPDTVTEMNEAFVYCESLVNVNIPKGVTDKLYDAFSGCSSLTSIIIPENVTAIPFGAFRYCDSLNNIVIPKSVTEIGPDAFYDCGSLTNITIPEGITRIGDSAFDHCDNLTNLVIPNSVTEIGYQAFAWCSSLTSLIIPNSVTEIGSSAFCYCINLNEITLSENITDIQYYTFEDCKSLKSIIIPKNVTNIDTNAFIACTNLRSVTIPESIISLGKLAFNGCENLTSIRYKGSKEQWEKLNVSLAFIGASNATIYYNVPSSHEHYYEYRLAKGASCTESGVEKWVCKICGEYYEKEIQPLGHTSVKDEAVAPTCAQPGMTEGSHCSVCGDVLIPQKTIPATDHLWGSWTIVKDASASNEGVQQRTCSKCGKTENKNIPKLTPVPTVAPAIPSAMTLAKGKNALLKPDTSWKNVKYSTSNKKVATVGKKGKIKAIGVGIAKITVKSGAKKAVCTITVPGTTAIKGIKTSISVKKGKKYTLIPKLSYVGKSDKITYKSSNKKVATVTNAGVVKAKKKGTTTITIKSGEETKKCKIKVK